MVWDQNQEGETQEMTENCPQGSSESRSQDKTQRRSQRSSYQAINQSDKWLHMKKEPSCESEGQGSRGTQETTVDLAEQRESWSRKRRQRQRAID